MKQPPLFAPQHDAGGRRTLKMQRGMLGDAIFDGPNGAYRPVLTRTWTKGAKNIWLWVGTCSNVSAGLTRASHATRCMSRTTRS